jgi:hypothetical protein
MHLQHASGGWQAFSDEWGGTLRRQLDQRLLSTALGRWSEKCPAVWELSRQAPGWHTLSSNVDDSDDAGNADNSQPCPMAHPCCVVPMPRVYSFHRRCCHKRENIMDGARCICCVLPTGHGCCQPAICDGRTAEIVVSLLRLNLRESNDKRL